MTAYLYRSAAQCLLLTCFVISIIDCNPKIHKAGYDSDGYHPRPPYTQHNPQHDQQQQQQQQQQQEEGGVGGEWFEQAQEELRRALEIELNQGVAHNVVVLLGDGMGVTTVTAARFYLMQLARHDPDNPRNITMQEARLAFEDFPHNALSMTYNTNAQTADSAGTATAIFTGEKTKMSVIGVSDAVEFENCEQSRNTDNQLTSILKHAQQSGKSTGLVTNTRITHASPASAYAHAASRYWESDSDMVGCDNCEDCEDIALQLITNPQAQQFNVILGGGRQAFLGNETVDPEYWNITGVRWDQRNLIQEWLDIKNSSGLSDTQYAFVYDSDGFESLDTANVQYVLGLFEPDHMQFETERTDEPGLPDMVRTAVEILSKNENGFFLIVEGGRIDHGHHETRAHEALHETVMFDRSVRVVTELTDPADTLVVTTADHSHVFTIAGHPTLHNDILDISDNVDGPDWQIDMAGKRWLTLGYTNGPGFFDYRYNMTGVDEEPYDIDMFEPEREQLRTDPDTLPIDPNDPYLRQDAAIPLYSETHGGEDVAIYALGPMSHLFHGTHEQNYIAHVVMYAACVGPNTEHCDVQTATAQQYRTSVALMLAAVFIGVLNLCA